MTSSTRVPFKLTNTLSRSLEVFEPANPDSVLVYTCGPTVYGDPHIGNLRTYIFEDILVKALRHVGFGVNRVMNITDVGHLTSDADEGEDKMEVGAKREGVTAWEVAKRYEQRFVDDMARLNIELPATLVRATDTIDDQIAFIKELEEKGYTYVTSDGVYFDSSKVADYGRLAHLNISGMQEGIRVAVGEKRSKTDFALWKFSGEPGKRHMEWDSPWGLGFPGWHIECSAIIRKTLGDSIDIHCGGADHISVHHPNEMAQSETLTGKELARYWLHSEFLLIDGGKMSKSLGNVYTVDDITARGFDPLAFRLLTYTAHYRSKLNFTWEALEAAQTQLNRLRGHYPQDDAVKTEVVSTALEQFFTALSTDLNVPEGMAIVWDFLGKGVSNGEKRAFLDEVDRVLSLGVATPYEFEIPDEVQRLLTEREVARSEKDWDRTDALRNAIADLGFQVMDTPSGQQLQKKYSQS